MRVLLNPAAGGGRAARSIERIRELAATSGATVEIGASAPDVVLRARRAADDGVDRLLVGGGDGTLHAAVQALAGSACALGILPLGRGNDLAGALGVPRRLDSAFALAASAPGRTIDLGFVAGRNFATVAGLGLDGEVVARVDRMNGLLPGPLAYPAAALAALLGFSSPRLRIEHDGGRMEGAVLLAAVANTSRFGAGMRIAPGADPGDGCLDLVVVRDLARWRALFLLPRVYVGAHVGHPAVEIVRTRRVVLSSDRPMRLQADGEILVEVGSAPLAIEIRPTSLRIAV